MSETRARLEPATSDRDVGGSHLPDEQPLDMPPQSFDARAAARFERTDDAAWVMRAALFGGAALLTAAFAYELYSVLSFVRATPLQLVFLVVSSFAFGWISVGSLSAAIGFLPLFAGERPERITLPQTGPIRQHTALLFPVYHEDPARIAGTVEAIADELRAIGLEHMFHVFVLSDSRSEEAGRNEEAVFAELAARLAGRTRVFYRRRRHNAAKKAGNIKDWIERFGGGYASFVVLDADSVMSGDTLCRLARAMEAMPSAGLIQTVPCLTGGRTLLQRLQQYAAATYGPTVAAGLAFWHDRQGSYWGHNAILRTAAFAQAAGLPDLPGRPPFGGHIQSHDFVEAVLLQRAGWDVHMVPSLAGSYEGAPPGLADLIVRDRRWAQGNLQHLAILGRRGLTPMGRLHLGMGAAAYLASAVWASSLVVGLVLALQGQHLIPSYFRDAKTLFPIWPVIDPGAAFRLFLATMAVVLLPKALGLVLALRRSLAERDATAAVLVVPAVLSETLFSMLLAPILMVTQTTAVIQIFAGRDSGWRAQRRDRTGLGLRDAFTLHRWHMAIGLVAAAICWAVSLALMAWMAPVLLGLIFSAVLSWWVARDAGPVLRRLLATPDDADPPAILRRSDQLARVWTVRLERAVPAQSAGRLTEAA